MQVAEVLPEPIQLKWSKMLVKEGVTTWKVEGQDYLDKLLNMIKRAYFTAEVQARIPDNDPTPKPKAKVNMTARDGSVSPTRPPSPSPPTASAANSNPRGNDSRGKNGDKGASGRNPSSSAVPKWSRWSCLIKDHDCHKLWTCPELFQLTT